MRTLAATEGGLGKEFVLDFAKANAENVKQNTPFQSSSGECRFNRLGGIHGGKKNAPESSGAITFSGTFSGTLVGARSGAGAGVGAGV